MSLRSLERIVGGSAVGSGINQGERNVNPSKKQVRMGQPLSYYSPRRKAGPSSANDASVNSTHTSARTALANTTRAGGGTGTPAKGQGSPFRGLLPNQQPATGKEFVLEELTYGDVGDPSESMGGHSVSLSGSKTPIPKEQLPEVLAGTLDHIVGQLDMVTRTLAILDKRLSMQEDLMAKHVFGQDKEDVN